MEFGEKIRAVRKKLNMTQEQFAKEMEVAFVKLNRWENGHFAPNYKAPQSLNKICEKTRLM